MGKIKTAKRQTIWNVINIKSRGIQPPQTYIHAFECLKEQDPLIQLRGNRHMSIKSMSQASYIEKEGYSRSILVKLSAYDILDSDKFYNKRSKENVSLYLDPDIVANESEIELIFVPKIHRFAMPKSSKISLKNVLKYFQEALDKTMGANSFDVTIVKDKDVIQRIFSSYAIYSIEADLTYSNRDPSQNFQTVFDQKIREMNPTQFKMNIKGTKDQPLEAPSDGLIEAAANMSESNGYIKARIREQESGKVTTINTERYPLNMQVNNAGDDIYTATYNELINRFGNEPTEHE